MTCRLVALGIDANDPATLARFWAEALGGWLVDDSGDEPRLVPTDGTSFAIEFQLVPEPRAPLQGRIHLDLTSTSWEDQQAQVQRLLELGGRHLDIGQGPDDAHIVLADPEGNELCIIEPTNNFLSTCGRFGSITCDGTHAVGCFWSEVLGWPLVWDEGEETAIRQDGTGPFITWGGPPLLPKPPKNRMHLDVAPAAGSDQQRELERLLGLGARRVDIGQGDVDWIVMEDPDGNEFCLLR